MEMVLANFCRTLGWELTLEDMGDDVVKFSLSHETEGDAAVMLTPELAEELADWLVKSNGQMITKLPRRLRFILRKIRDGVKINKADRAHIAPAIILLREHAGE